MIRRENLIDARTPENGLGAAQRDKGEGEKGRGTFP